MSGANVYHPPGDYRQVIIERKSPVVFENNSHLCYYNIESFYMAEPERPIPSQPDNNPPIVPGRPNFRPDPTLREMPLRPSQPVTPDENAQQGNTDPSLEEIIRRARETANTEPQEE